MRGFVDAAALMVFAAFTLLILVISTPSPGFRTRITRDADGRCMYKTWFYQDGRLALKLLLDPGTCKEIDLREALRVLHEFGDVSGGSQ